MPSRNLNCEFTLPPGFYHFTGRPPLRAADPGPEASQPRVFVPGEILSWYGTQTIKAPGIELLVHLWFRPSGGEDTDAELIWSGHQLTLPGVSNTIVILSPSTIPYFSAGWVWVDFESITPDSGPGVNSMWEIQLTIFYD